MKRHFLGRHPLAKMSRKEDSANTIVSFGNVGSFISNMCTTIAPTEDAEKLSKVIERMQGHVEIPEEVDGEMFVTLDDNVAIAEELMDKEIVDAQTDDREETNSEETEEAVPTVIRAVAILCDYLVQTGDVHA